MCAYDGKRASGAMLLGRVDGVNHIDGKLGIPLMDGTSPSGLPSSGAKTPARPLTAHRTSMAPSVLVLGRVDGVNHIDGTLGIPLMDGTSPSGLPSSGAKTPARPL